jgi:manganese/zinc/iron transport system permease protein
MSFFAMMSYTNPYSGLSFFGFFVELFKRLLGFATGQLPLQALVSDEIQLIVLMSVAGSAALVGSFLVLRKMTMLANSLSHTILLGIVVAFVWTQDGFLQSGHYHTMNIQAMLLASLIVGVLTAFLTEFLTKSARLQEDASTGIVFTSLFALGIVLVTLLTRSAHVGTEVVMGNVDALQLDDCKLVLIILAINIFMTVLFFKEYKITTFDPALAKALGISTLFFNYLLMVQASATTIGAFRAVGVLMVLAFITGPVLAARLLTDHLKTLLLYSIGFGCLASLLGVALSRHFLSVYGIPLSTSGIVVCVITLLFLISIVLRKYKLNKLIFTARTK